MSLTPRRHAPMYHPSLDHDSCGVGLVADIHGRPSRAIVEKALAGLVNLTHRGGVGADARTGDGAGIHTQIPHALLADALADLGAGELGPGEYAVAMTFLPREREVADGKHIVEYALERRGLHAIGWRQVPIDPSVLGETAKAALPDIWQAFITRPEGMDGPAFEKELMIARRIAEREAAAAACRVTGNVRVFSR